MISTLWLSLGLITGWLIVGLAASRFLAARPARAHRILVLTMMAAFLTPAAIVGVRRFDWGLLPSSESISSDWPFEAGAVGFTQPPRAQRHESIQPQPIKQLSRSSQPTSELSLEAKGEMAMANDLSNAGASSVSRDSVTKSTPPNQTKEMSSARVLAPWRRPLLYAWGVLSTLLLIRTVVSFLRGAKLVRQSQPVHSSKLSGSLQQAGRVYGGAIQAQLRSSAVISSPVIWCWSKRPIVLLPAETAAPPRGWVHVLRHELAHYYRKDHWATLAAEILTALLPWHPLSYMVRRKLADFSEKACDDWALADGESPTDYAETLLGLTPQSQPLMALSAVGSARRLEQRIGYILTRRQNNPQVGRMWSWAVLGCVLLLASAAALLQPRLAVSSNVVRDEAAAKATPVGRIAALEESSESATIRVTGRIVDENGQPLKGARLAIVGGRNQPRAGGDLSFRIHVMARGQVNERGEFTLSAAKLPTGSFRQMTLLAAKDGLAVDWKQLDPDGSRQKVELKLEREQIIRGRLVDLQGMPAAGVKLHVRSIMIPELTQQNGVGFQRRQGTPADFPWPASIVSNQQGRFVVHGVAAKNGFVLEVEDDRFAQQTLYINSGLEEMLEKKSGLYRPQAAVRIEPNDEETLALAPAQIVEGVISYEDSKQPAAGARVTVFASQQRFGSSVGVAGKADEKGRFRINPKPGSYFRVTAYPPEETPYLIRKTEIEWPAAARNQTVNISVPRGVLLHGAIKHKTTGDPIAGAALQFIPKRSNNSLVPPDVITGWQATVVTDEKGNYQLAAPAGPGHLMVHGPTPDYVLQQISSNELYRGRPGGQRHYVHAVKKLELDPQAKSKEVSLTLQPAITAKGKLLGPKGELVKEALMISRLYVTSSSMGRWRGFPLRAMNGSYELHGVDPEKSCPVYFLDAHNGWGATVLFGGEGGAKDTTIRLEPCGQATARFVDKEGKPIAGYRPMVKMVVTDGPPRLSNEARQGKLAADEDFLANIDRRNYWSGPLTDKDGKCTLGWLIPGAKYRLENIEEGYSVTRKEITVKAGEKLELGEIVINRPR